MKVIFGRSNTIGSLLIRLATWSRWSHCGVIIGDDVIHAIPVKGVIREPLSEFKKRYKFELCEMRGDASLAVKFIGCKYDWGGVFGHWFGIWNDAEKWFCSELVAYCSKLFRRDRVNRVTQEHCYMISHSIEGK